LSDENLDPATKQVADLPGYAEALDEIQEILSTLESETTDIDLLAERVQRADLLLRHCRSRLDEARLQVEQVVAGSVAPHPADDADTPVNED
jgi:exodeoxyribonuclease VII small subunit